MYIPRRPGEESVKRRVPFTIRGFAPEESCDWTIGHQHSCLCSVGGVDHVGLPALVGWDVASIHPYNTICRRNPVFTTDQFGRLAGLTVVAEWQLDEVAVAALPHSVLLREHFQRECTRAVVPHRPEPVIEPAPDAP